MKIYKRLVCMICAVMMLMCTGSDMIRAEEVATDSGYWPAGPEIVSASGIVMEADTGTILYEKNINDVHYPASITKILTTLLAIENSSMDEVVTFSYDAVHKTEGSGIARDVDEQMTMEQCLYAIMLASANECAYAVAEHVGGDIGTFVQMMNDRAAQIGCQNTHFNNCNGLPDEQHYTSAYDMALIAREAYKNEAFRIICGTKTYTIPFTNKHTDEETYLQNHHQMLYPLKTRKYLYDYCTGGKTGYTTVANNTLVTYAEKDGMTLICVVMDAPAGSHYEDTRALFDFCFDNFKAMNVSENETSYTQQNAAGGSKMDDFEPFVALDPSGTIILPVTAEFSDAESKIVYDDTNEDILGSIEYTYAGRAVGSVDITATNASVDSFEFHGQKSTSAAEDTEDKKQEVKKQNKVFQINLRVIAAVVIGIMVLALLIFLGWKFIDNFYAIRRKLHFDKKPRSPYKTIRTNKMYRKKRRKRR